MLLIFDHDLDSVKMNRLVKYTGHWSFALKFIVCTEINTKKLNQLIYAGAKPRVLSWGSWGWDVGGAPKRLPSMGLRVLPLEILEN